tara:strand:+ start:2991 stop:3125 length:135 start_codon:yes stop_codon:yes gene_type:complete
MNRGRVSTTNKLLFMVQLAVALFTNYAMPPVKKPLLTALVSKDW